MLKSRFKIEHWLAEAPLVFRDKMDEMKWISWCLIGWYGEGWMHPTRDMRSLVRSSHIHIKSKRILQRKGISGAKSEIQPVTSKNGTWMYLRTRGGPDHVCRKWQHCTRASNYFVMTSYLFRYFSIFSQFVILNSGNAIVMFHLMFSQRWMRSIVLFNVMPCILV